MKMVHLQPRELSPVGSLDNASVGAPRVLITVPALEKSGGVANYFRTLAPYFGLDVEYLTRGSRGTRHSVIGEATRLIGDYIRFIRGLVGARAAQVVHVNTSFGWRGAPRDLVFVLAARALGKPVIVFFRGWDPTYESEFLRPSRRFLRETFFRADRIIVLASEFASKLREWGYRGAIIEETTVVDDRLLEGFGEPKILARADRTRLTLLFLARLETDKGIYQALDAFGALTAEYSSLRLIVAGDGRERENAIRYAEATGLKNVDFVGYIRDRGKAEVMRQADIYVFPSFHGEGMPNSVLEAMAFGLPVVARAVGGIPDVVRHGENGFLYEGTTAADLIPHVRTLLDSPDLRVRMGVANSREARARHLASQVSARLGLIYRDLLAERYGTRRSGARGQLGAAP
jgi:glycosyltransferase involved in cell wall biosynthesis